MEEVPSQRVAHSNKQNVVGMIHINTIEGFSEWSIIGD
jgi:hypothetical protein